MTEESRLETMTREAERWKRLAAEAADKACFNCEEYREKDRLNCGRCRMKKIREEAVNTAGQEE